MAHPVIALLTDFGTRDHYAGTMKGVALGVCPSATLVDITHDIAPHDVLGAAFELAAAYRYFPPGTIFLVVVDPGVGSARRGIAAQAGGYTFVAPDNGVLTLVLKPGIQDAAPARVVELQERAYTRPDVSRTFEGRDRFAPAAAWLATGIELAALGPAVTAWHELPIPEAQVGAAGILGEVVRVDRFGNLITNLERDLVDRCAGPGTLEIRLAEHRIGPLVATYADTAAGTLCALFGSTNHLEIAVNGGSAAERLAAGRGARVIISRAGVTEAQ